MAVVVEQNEKSLNRPRVKVFFSTRSQLPLPREPIDIGAPGCSNRIVGHESNRDWKFSNLAELWVEG